MSVCPAPPSASNHSSCANYSGNAATQAESVKVADAANELKKYMHYYSRYENHAKSIKFAQKTRAAAEERMAQLQAIKGTGLLDVQVSHICQFQSRRRGSQLTAQAPARVCGSVELVSRTDPTTLLRPPQLCLVRLASAVRSSPRVQFLVDASDTVISNKRILQWLYVYGYYFVSRTARTHGSPHTIK